jgi:hypothetical protein
MVLDLRFGAMYLVLMQDSKLIEQKQISSKFFMMVELYING